MENAVHMGQKLRIMAEKRSLKPKDVAAFFGVKAPSVYDWYEHGRIAKKHYDKLVEFSGYPITWWLGMEPETAPSVQETRAVYVTNAPEKWPFLLFDRSEWMCLSQKEREDFEKSIAGAILWVKKTAAQA